MSRLNFYFFWKFINLFLDMDDPFPDRYVWIPSQSLSDETCPCSSQTENAVKLVYKNGHSKTDKTKILLTIGITWLFAYSKGGNFNIHIWAWFGYFICLGREIIW